MTYLASRLAIEKELGNYLGCGIINSLGYFHFVSIQKHLIVNFLSTPFVGNFFHQKFKNHELKKWVVIQSYQLYCIFFPPMIPKLMEFSFCHISKMSIYSICKPLIVYRCRILSEFTSRTCMHRHDFLPSREH